MNVVYCKIYISSFQRYKVSYMLIKQLTIDSHY